MKCYVRVYNLFESADVDFDVDTTHRGQARDVARKLSLEFDAVITVSGDGLIHEILNGFSEHANPRGAFTIPVAPIPTGSGNGLSLNLLGFDVKLFKCIIVKKLY